LMARSLVELFFAASLRAYIKKNKIRILSLFPSFLFLFPISSLFKHKHKPSPISISPGREGEVMENIYIYILNVIHKLDLTPGCPL